MESISNEILQAEYFIAPLVLLLSIMAGGLLWSELSKTRFGRAITHSDYLTQAGTETKEYFDADAYLGVPENIRATAGWLKAELRRIQADHGRIQRLVFIEKRGGPVGSLTLKDLLSSLTGIPAIIVRLGIEFPNPLFKVVGNSIDKNTVEIIEPGENLVIISDVLTTGSTILEAKDILEGCHANVLHSIVLYDRAKDVDRKSFKETMGLSVYFTKESHKSQIEILTT